MVKYLFLTIAAVIFIGAAAAEAGSNCQTVCTPNPFGGGQTCNTRCW